MTTPDTRAKELAGLLRERIGSEFDHEAHLSGDEANEIASLIESLYREREKIREALRPFEGILDEGEGAEGVMLTFAAEDGHQVVTALPAEAFRAVDVALAEQPQ